MIEIETMSHPATDELLTRVKYGHLGCSSDNHPYVVPIHFGYDGDFVYIFTTEGKKSEIIDANPEICLQVEEIFDNDTWQSVIVVGNAEKITDPDVRDKALQSILAANPTLTPALSVRWIDPWVREIRDIEVIYRVKPSLVSGRRTAPRAVAG